MLCMQQKLKLRNSRRAAAVAPHPCRECTVLQAHCGINQSWKRILEDLAIADEDCGILPIKQCLEITTYTKFRDSKRRGSV